MFGVGLSKIEFLESQRGNIAGWLFIIIVIWSAINNGKIEPRNHLNTTDLIKEKTEL